MNDKPPPKNPDMVVIDDFIAAMKDKAGDSENNRRTIKFLQSVERVFKRQNACINELHGRVSQLEALWMTADLAFLQKIGESPLPTKQGEK